MAFHPYLFFGGNCRQAFIRYQEIFGGELMMVPFGDAPTEERMPTEQADLIMHAALMFEGNLLMASDDPSPDFGPVRGVSVNYTTGDVDEAKRVFEGLAAGGTVTMPMEATFWSPMFGTCVDGFGIPWMISAEAPSDPA